MPLRVMIIEDNPETLELYALALSGTYQVLSCPEATQAVSLLEAGEIPHLIICDLMMPTMGGDEFLRIIQADTRWSHIPVILASGGDNLKKRAADLGAQGYLRKPFDLDSLENTVKKHLLPE